VNFQVQVSWFVQPSLSKNWNLVFKTPVLDVCQLTSTAKILPAYKAFIDTINKTVPNIPMDCPIKAGTFEFRNITVSDEITDRTLDYGLGELWSSTLPNGLHKIKIKVFPPADPTGVVVQWITDHYKRLPKPSF
jgi:Protein of unknown function (DUF1091)